MRSPIRKFGFIVVLVGALGATEASAAECPNWEFGTAIGLAKSCGMTRASEKDLRATIPVLAKTAKRDCSPAHLSNMQGAISDGMNYDRYDNHFELCGSLDQ